MTSKERVGAPELVPFSKASKSLTCPTFGCEQATVNVRVNGRVIDEGIVEVTVQRLSEVLAFFAPPGGGGGPFLAPPGGAGGDFFAPAPGGGGGPFFAPPECRRGRQVKRQEQEQCDVAIKMVIRVDRDVKGWEERMVVRTCHNTRVGVHVLLW